MSIANYRPGSILSNISKIYERLMFKQTSEYFKPILSQFVLPYIKCSTLSNSILAMLEKWKLVVLLYHKRDFGALLIDLSKDFDCLSHDLLLAKSKCLWMQFTGIKTGTKLFIKSKPKN